MVIFGLERHRLLSNSTPLVNRSSIGLPVAEYGVSSLRVKALSG